MKITVNINQKIGMPNYGSFGASCSFEMEIDQALLLNDPQTVLSNCRLLGDLARAGVDRELDLQRRTKPAEAPAKPKEDRLRTGDPAYERQQPQASARQADRAADGRTEEQRRLDREDRQRAYREAYGDPPAAEERPRPNNDGGSQREERGSGRRGGGGRGEGAPTSARQFLGWLGKQDQDVKDRVKRVIKSWDLPTMMREWDDSTAEGVYREITEKRESASHNGNGNGNGRY